MKSIFLLFCFVLGFFLNVHAEGLTGKTRENFIESFSSSCFDAQRKNKDNGRASSDSIKAYCTCSAIYTSDRTPQSEMSIFKQMTGIFDKQQGRALSEEATSYCREQTKASAAGAYFAAVVSANEFRKSICGKTIQIPEKWRDVNGAEKEIISYFSITSRSEVADFLSWGKKTGSEFSSLYKTIPADKCDVAISVFLSKFDKAMKTWESVK